MAASLQDVPVGWITAASGMTRGLPACLPERDVAKAER
jgi:hypothetical protein